MRCLLLPAALDDLTEIGRYIARDNPARAESFVNEIERPCRDIAKMPGMGKRRPDIAAEMRSMTYGNYVVFYSLHKSEIHIEHVFHGARDLGKIFENDRKV